MNNTRFVLVTGDPQESVTRGVSTYWATESNVGSYIPYIDDVKVQAIRINPGILNNMRGLRPAVIIIETPKLSDAKEVVQHFNQINIFGAVQHIHVKLERQLQPSAE